MTVIPKEANALAAFSKERHEYKRFNVKENLKRNYFDLIYDEGITLSEGHEYFMLKYELDSEIKIHWLVKLFENPSSRFSLPGAIDLFNHDLLHCLLNRGITEEDEAFVIGYTMGSVKKIKKFHFRLFKFVSKYLYRNPYKLTDEHLKEFDRACSIAKHNPKLPELNLVPFKEKLNVPIKDILAELEITIENTNLL